MCRRLINIAVLMILSFAFLSACARKVPSEGEVTMINPKTGKVMTLGRSTTNLTEAYSPN